MRVVAPSASYLRPEGEAEEGAGGLLRVPVAARGRGALGNAWHQVRLWRALRDGAREALSRFDADLVMVSSPPLLASLAGLGLRGRNGRRLPLVVDQRDLWPDIGVEAGAFGATSPWALGLRFVETRLLDAAALVTTVTESKRARLRERTNRPVVLIPNGVDDSWTDEPPARESRGGDFELLYAGNLGRAQDAAGLVRAVAGLTGVRATLVGDGEEREAVVSAIRELGAPAELHPPEPRTAVRRRLGACGCAFVTLRTAELVDAVPSKLLEAMALGVPVLLSAAGESARLLVESGGGVVVAPGDDAALRRAVEELSGMDAGELRSMGEKGRAFVLSRFRRADAAEKLSRTLKELAA